MFPVFHPRARTAALAAALAFLFVAGSLSIPPMHGEDDAAVPHAAEPSAAEPPATDAPPPSGLPGPEEAEPEPLSETDGHSLYGSFFEENLGQWEHDAAWVLRGGPLVSLDLAGLEIFSPEGTTSLSFAGGEASDIEVVDVLPGTTSVFGAEFYTGARHAERLRVLDVWPGIDVDVYVTDAGSLQYDFRVHPGADPSNARLTVSGAEPRIDNGRLVVGPHTFAAPYTYQSSGEIPSHFEVEGQTVTVEVGAYDPSELLVIDPELLYGTIVGGRSSSTGHRVYAAAETGDGTYFGGSLYQYRSKNPQITQTFGPPEGRYTAFFVHLAPDDNSLLSFVELRNTYRYGYTFGYDLDVDQKGRVYVVGQTGYYISGGNGIPVVGGEQHDYYFDGYVARFEPRDGGKAYDLQYSTHIFGDYIRNYYERATGVHVNPDGSFWVAGGVSSDDISPSPGMVVKDPTTYEDNYYLNFYAMRFQDGDVPEPDLASLFGGHYYYNYPSEVEGDSEGNLYFVGTARFASWFPGAKKFPTTPDAIHPDPIGGSYDHYYGKISAQDGAIDHLSYWGSKGTDYGYVGSTGQLQGPGIDVVGKDEIVVAGTARCCVTTSDIRMTPDGYGSYDGFVSHIKLGEPEPVFSTHVGSTSIDYIHDVAFDASQAVYYIGGVARRAVEPQIEFPEDMPRSEHNNRYDAFVQAIQPSRADRSSPLDDQAEHITSYTMYVGNARGSWSSTYNRVYDVEISSHRSLLVSGTQGGSSSIDNRSPTTEDAMATDGTSTFVTGFLQKYQMIPPIIMRATDGFNEASSDGKQRLDTKTLTDVQLTASFNQTMFDWAIPAELSWDLDGDGTFEDAYGPGPHIITRGHEEKVKPCVQLPGEYEAAPPLESCLTVFFENRPPVVALSLFEEPAGFGDPLPYYYTGDRVWYDASSSYDPEGVLDYEVIDWTVETLDAEGNWVPDQSAQVGGAASLGVIATYAEPGQKRITVFLQDEVGARAGGSLSVEIRPLPIEVSCALGGPVRDGRWLDLDVELPEGIEIKEWTLEFEDRVVTGDQVSFGRIRTAENLTVEGPGTARLTLVSEDQSQAVCALPYHAGARQVTADFTWNEAVAGVPVTFTDRSYPLHAGQPITSWEWMVDGVVVDASKDTQHTFAHPGVYMVTLTVGDGVATDSYTRPVSIGDERDGPLARIGVASPPYHAGMPIDFTDESLPGDAPIESWTWRVGDAKRSGQDAVFSLPAGDHEVALTVTDENDLDSTDSIEIRVIDLGGVVPEFSSSTTSPAIGEEVVFTDISRIGGVDITSQEWEFGDGSRSGQGDETTHRFWYAGTYNVTLTIYEAGGQRFSVTHQVTVVDPEEEALVDVTDPELNLPTADAGPDRRVLAGSVVVLDASRSTGHQSEGLSAAWRQISGPSVALVPQESDVSLRVPYSPGEVLVFELIVSDANGPSQPDKVRLSVVEEHADGVGEVSVPEAEFLLERDGRRVHLTAPGHAVDAEYVWDLGDGTVLVGREVVHEYLTWDAYDVTLTVRDVHGQESSMQDKVEVRPAQDTQESRVQDSGARFFGQSIQNLLLAGLVLFAAAGAAALLASRRR